jgi:segregation and condensation protein B
MDEYMTDEHKEIKNEEQQEAEEGKFQVQDNNEDSEIVEEIDEVDLAEEFEESEKSDLSNQSDASEESDLPKNSDSDTTLESVIEAVLFASDESLTPARLANIIESTTKQIRDLVNNLNDKYEANNSAFRIEQIAGGYQMLTLSKYNHWLKKLLRARSETKLSPAAMETLAIIAYKQPVIRADIEAIRGVAVGEVIRSLSIKGLVKIVGRAEILGRPMLYGTTKKFLEVFGLNTLKDLPKIEELKKPPA